MMHMIEIFFLGLIIGFIFYEAFGISPGGVVAPAYCALFVNQPMKICMTIVIAVVVWLLLKFLAGRFIIYGRRRLLLALLFGFVIKMIVETQLQPLDLFHLDLHSIGYIIPGLIANEMLRQNVLLTLGSLGVVTMLVYFVSLLIF